MRNLFRIKTILATIACTFLTGSILAAEVSTCFIDSKSTESDFTNQTNSNLYKKLIVLVESPETRNLPSACS